MCVGILTNLSPIKSFFLWLLIFRIQIYFFEIIKVNSKSSDEEGTKTVKYKSHKYLINQVQKPSLEDCQEDV